MNSQLLELIDTEISKLQTVKSVLTGAEAPIVNHEDVPHIVNGGLTLHHPRLIIRRKKGGMSPEGRARVAAAQKARWAKIHAAQKKHQKAA